jgi:glycosyltransferase involved in cell wall biosynthesis
VRTARRIESANVSLGVVVGIDASRNRSGGSRAHLAGFLAAGNPSAHGITRVHVWSHKELLDAVPDAPWLVKHSPSALGQSLLREAWWQFWALPGEVRRHGCDVLLSLDAGTIGRFRPSIVMSRDMLSFEPREIVRYGYSLGRLRLVLLKFIQARSLRRASGALFLTQYAADVIQRLTGRLDGYRVIPHGISDTFRQETAGGLWPEPAAKITCVYVSNTDVYKHQWNVVRAVAALRKKGYPLVLRLVGGASGRAKPLLDEAIAAEDPAGEFVEMTPTVPHEEVPRQLARADIFVFASSCENMPNTLVEAMAAGLPIACSNRGPMPEILRDGGTYFDPEQPGSIAAALEQLLVDQSFRRGKALQAKTLSAEYSWARCARETWAFIADVAARRRP